jgi:anti-anti-sigma factor
VSDLHEVLLQRVPVDLHNRTAEHSDALQREFELIQRASPEERSTPHRLVELIGQLHAQFGTFGEAARLQIADASARGLESTDLTYHLPVEAGDAARRLGDQLDEADDYCSAGEHLLTLVTPADALAYRRWFLDEVSRQLDGEEPMPWPGIHDTGGAAPASRPAPAPATVTGQDTPTVKVSDALDAVSAPALRNILNDVCAGKPSRVTVDLSEASFIDSVGVSVLLSAYGRLREQGASMEVVASPVVSRTLSIMELQDVLRLRSA